MRTDCTEEQLVFQGVGGRQVVARFDGGRITSDAGVLLLREVAERSGLLRHFAQCFTDYRAPELIEHTVEELVAQRVLALACGYEDLNDHDVLRDDALLAVAAGKTDATGATRKRERDRGHALAGKSTLNRLEGTPAAATAAARSLIARCAAVRRRAAAEQPLHRSVSRDGDGNHVRPTTTAHGLDRAASRRCDSR